MSQHGPTALVHCDVFPDTIAVTPRQVAEAAWSDIKDWVRNGYQPVLTVVMEDDSLHDVDLSEEPERSEDDPHPVIERVTHVRCGTTFTDPFTLDVMNEQDSACPVCCEIGVPNFPPPEAYGELVWEHRDGTLWLTESEDDGEMVKHQPIRTHVQVYKSWTNDPDNGEWWVVPRPNTGDIDGSDNLIVGFDTFEQALAAVSDPVLGLHSTFNDLLGPAFPSGVAWRDRSNPIYQPTSREVNV